VKAYTIPVVAVCIAGCASPLPTPVGTYRHSWTTVDLRQNPPIEEVHTQTLEIGADGRLEFRSEPMQRAVGTFCVMGSSTLRAAVETQEVRLSLIGRERKMEWVPREHATWYLRLDPLARTFSRYYTRKSSREADKERDRTQRTTHCLVSGAVKCPGEIECPVPTPVESILSRAGGFTSRANPRHMTIIRDDTHITFDPTAVREDQIESTLVRPGDLVIVGAFMRLF